MRQHPKGPNPSQEYASMAEATTIVTLTRATPASPESRFIHVYRDHDAMRVSEDFWAVDEAIEFLGDGSLDGYAYSVKLTAAGPVKRDLEEEALDWRAEQRAEARHQVGLSRFYNSAR